MSSYQIGWLPNERVIYGKVGSDYDVRRDTSSMSNHLVTMLDGSALPVPAILDLTDLSVGAKNETLKALALDELEVLGHPKLIELLIVDKKLSFHHDTLVTPQASFGGRSARLFPSAHAAFDYACEKYGVTRISVN